MMEIQGIDKLIAQWSRGMNELDTVLNEGMSDALDAIQEATPEYPSERPNQKYIRTEALGKSMGSGFGGGMGGAPDIREIKQTSTYIEGRIGSQLGYAEYVIGERTQAWMHVGRWWTNSTLVSKAYDAVQRVFALLVDKWAKVMGA